MADLILLLGAFEFQENEIPASINFGGSQNLAIHQLIGGGRIVDSMGNNDHDISWSGLFFNNVTTGLSAIDRAREVNTLRTLGLELELVFYDLIYLVKIKEFRPSFERFYQVPYSITLQVIQDLNLPASPLNNIPFLDAILNDLNFVNAGAQFLNDPTLNSLLGNFSSALSSAGALESASPSVINGLINSSSAASSRIGTLIGQYKNNLAG